MLKAIKVSKEWLVRHRVGKHKDVNDLNGPVYLVWDTIFVKPDELMDTKTFCMRYDVIEEDQFNQMIVKRTDA